MRLLSLHLCAPGIDDFSGEEEFGTLWKTDVVVLGWDVTLKFTVC